jgi:predicted chitinase
MESMERALGLDLVNDPAPVEETTCHGSCGAWRWQSHHRNADANLGDFIMIPRWCEREYHKRRSTTLVAA